MVHKTEVKENKKGKEKLRTENIKITGFSDLEKLLCKEEGDESGVIYQVGNKEKRYILWEKGTKPLICIGANPSMAGSDTEHPTDPTITRIRNVVKALNEAGKECDGWIMLNLYPQRTPKPGKLHCNETYDRKMMDENHEVIRIVFEMFPKAITLLAWGNIIDLSERGYLEKSFSKIVSMGGERNWCIRGGFTGRNNPRHQLYVSNKAELEKVKIELKEDCYIFYTYQKSQSSPKECGQWIASNRKNLR